jgi:PAS/PAC sensor hybrid histidine kinase
MTKILLVEDDKSLREIYGVRLLAEGYDIVSAGDGEEALAMAIKERPRLILSDVMMPKFPDLICWTFYARRQKQKTLR